MNPLDWFPGRKTYILAIGAMFTALGAFLVGDMELGSFVEALFTGLMVMTLRKGMK